MSSVQFLPVPIPLLPAGLFIKLAYRVIHWPSLLHNYTKWNIFLFCFFQLNYIIIWCCLILFQCSWGGQYLYVEQLVSKPQLMCLNFIHILSVLSVHTASKLNTTTFYQCIYFLSCFLKIYKSYYLLLNIRFLGISLLVEGPLCLSGEMSQLPWSSGHLLGIWNNLQSH